jgi:hypothetical protein
VNYLSLKKKAMEYTTGPLAQLLKKYGFPQPKMNTGQIWFNPKEQLVVIAKTTKLPKDQTEWIYSPPSSDILRALGAGWSLEKTEVGWSVKKNGATIISFSFAPDTCALAFLQEKGYQIPAM